MTNPQKQLFLIDGYGFLFRAYHSLPPLTNPKGVPVGAIYGFTNMILKLKNKIDTNHIDQAHILLVLDSGRQSFRNEIYPEYKAHRPEAPEDLKPQFPIIRDVAKALNIEIAERVGFEADDIIAAYTKQAKDAGYFVTIVSSDKDLMQLVVDGSVEMLDPMKDRKIASVQVYEKFGVTPDKVLDVLSLMGDSSDNIPGVAGIGPKTASELINKFETLENLLENTDKIPQQKRRETLQQSKELAIMSKKLASLNFDAPTDIPLENLRLKQLDNEVLKNFLLEHGFKSIALKQVAVSPMPQQNNSQSRLQLKKENAPTQLDAQPQVVEVINNIEQLENFIKKLTQQLKITVFSYIEKGEIEAIILLNNKIAGIIKPAKTADVVSITGQNDLFSAPQQIAKQTINYALPILQNLFKQDEINFTFNSAKNFLSISGLKIAKNFDDIEVLNYLINGSSSVEINLPKLEELANKTNENFIEYAVVTHKIGSQLKHQISDAKLTNIYQHFDKPLIGVLLDMEKAGVKIDVLLLKNLSSEFKSRLAALETEIHQLANEQFNIGSPKQLGEVLFDKMGIAGGKKSKSGQYVTDVDVLETLSLQGFTIADKILEWRGLSKLISTYTEALQECVNPKTGRVHTNFKHTATTTGRLSSANPNIQNIPIKSEDGRKIRKAFTAEAGNKLIGADYSQIELRLLAHVADIEVLKQAFKQGKDIHAATAAQIFGVELEQVTKEQRNRAKTVNFGIIYGQSAFGLAKQLGISNTDAKEIIDKYFKQYPGIKAYMDRTIEFARQHGYVETIFKRKIYVSGINDKNGMRRSLAERAAINAPLQGSAADIIKLAMIEIGKLETQKFGNLENTKNLSFQVSNFPTLLLQIHDELIIECPENIAEQTAQKVKKIMESVAHLSVPLIVDTHIGNNWGEAH